jgi:uncharacterized membrane protein YvbJ
MNTTSNGWLDKILNTGTGLFGVITQKDQAAAANRSAQKIADANARAAESKSKALIIGGAIVAVLLVVVFLFRK